jgi:hypothetical protein
MHDIQCNEIIIHKHALQIIKIVIIINLLLLLW